MTIAIPIVMVLIAWGFIGGAQRLFTLGCGLLAFGALAVVPPDLSGGVSLIASSVTLALMLVMLVVQQGPERVIRTAFDFNGLGFLALFTVWACFSSLAFPALFRGEVFIYPLRSPNEWSFIRALDYTSSNLTQACYLALSFLVALGVYVLRVSTPDFQSTFVKAFLVAAVMVFVTGVLDIVGLNGILSLTRTASYALVGDTSIGSSKRIVGAQPEASAFGSLAVGIFAVLVLCRDQFSYTRSWLLSCAATGLLGAMSASSTAYGMLAVTFAVFSLQCAASVLVGTATQRERATFELILAYAGLAIVLVFVFLSDQARYVVTNLIDELIFRKALSSSYEERTRWTMTTLQAFYDSYGVGVGVGSSRSSNGAVNLLASTGVIGALLMLTFITRLAFCGLASGRYNALLAIIPNLTGFIIAGTTTDYGVLVGILFGLQAGNTNLGRNTAGHPVHCAAAAPQWTKMPSRLDKVGADARSASAGPTRTAGTRDG